MLDSTELIRQLVALPGPPGQEDAVRNWLAERLRALGYAPETDAKGNLLVRLNASLPESVEGSGVRGSEKKRQRPSILVTAHMDEIALIVTGVERDGTVGVTAYGGSHPWKWGEGPVSILTRKGPIAGILSYGSIHTTHPSSVVEQARRGPLTWDLAYIFTGLESIELREAGVRPGLRAVLGPSRRTVTEFGPYLASYFLDDRADLAVWLMALERLKTEGVEEFGDVTFLASASEEVGGEGAQFWLTRQPTDICVALEIGPKTPEADFSITPQPSIWVRDGYAAMEARDGDILADCCAELGQTPFWQYLSRGGSDASCSAAKGLTARPVTLGLPVENSHGYEIMHRDAPEELTRLLLAYLRRAA
jgi:putative aminopeptidase FrvX